MSIPCKINPFGKSNKPTAFELVVKPTFLAKCPNVPNTTNAFTDTNTTE